MSLSELQEKIIKMSNDKSVIIASAASGKTQTMTEKVRQILKSGTDPRKVAVITFTTMAAAELRQRLGEDYKDGIFIGTIHALANFLLCRVGINTRRLLDDENFDGLFDEVKKNPHCIIQYEWILLDEAQDSDELQFEFLFDMLNPLHFFVVGDCKQAIYQFKGCDATLMTQLAQRPGVKLFDLNENYRNGRCILDFARRIIRPSGLEDNSIPMRPVDGKVEEIPFSFSSLVELIKNQDQPRDWAILTRTNKEILDISIVLTNNGIPFDTFRQADLTRGELIDKMGANTVKLLTIHSSKGLAFNNVIVVGARFHPDDERNVCYVAATRARNKLYWTGMPPRRKKPQPKAKPKMTSW